MTNAGIKILEAALENYESEMFYFNLYETKGTDWAWTRSNEYSGRVRGLLDAFEILTGEKIYAFEIEEKLHALT